MSTVMVADSRMEERQHMRQGLCNQGLLGFHAGDYFGLSPLPEGFFFLQKKALRADKSD